jgi:hypothetical protein
LTPGWFNIRVNIVMKAKIPSPIQIIFVPQEHF